MGIRTAVMHISISPVKQIRGRLYLMCVHESTKGSSAKPQLNWAKECEKNQQKTLTPLLFLPAWKRPDDNNVEHGAPVSATDPSSSNALPSLHPPGLWKASTCLWFMPVVWRWILHIKASRIMGVSNIALWRQLQTKWQQPYLFWSESRDT